MARNRGPILRRSRRLGMALDPKSERKLDRRPYPPGPQSKSRRPRKMSGYGTQLQEKQRARFMYDVLERQFRGYYKRASRMRGVMGDNLISLLEQRLDNVVYRLGFASLRSMARQLVAHGHIQVNGRKVSVPSYLVRPDCIVALRDKTRKNDQVKICLDTAKGRGVPAWLELDSDQFQGTVRQLPAREDITMPIQEQLIVELYSK